MFISFSVGKERTNESVERKWSFATLENRVVVSGRILNVDVPVKILKGDAPVGFSEALKTLKSL